ncbi:type II secretion system protein GspF [Altererythrobacter sp. SALINAS58]|uniref:type II secretion system F family protein n=1 Tax=Alteripontixanthobacter muriae TaxID=2705546 RepID=UPI0015776709|nr:type II secretion system protein GspF [Alteripontixanthobacter muriae]
MAGFAYQAIDAKGQTRKGVIEAGNAAAARAALRAQKLLPVAVTAGASTSAAVVRPNRTMAGRENVPGEAAVTRPSLRERYGRGRLSSQGLVTATRQLSTLIGSDVRIEEALRLVSRQNDAPALAEVLMDVRGKVMEGSSFARGLMQHPRIFPDFYVASINAGEQSGRLPEVLAYLADFVEARHAANRKLKLALLYPALLAGVSALMMTMMMIYVVPDIVRVFVSRGADLPLLTRMLIAVSGALNSFGLFLLIGSVAIIFFARLEFAKPHRRLAFDRLMATRRPFARFSRQLNAARFAATLATLVQSAVPLLDALRAAAAVVPNRHVRERMEDVADRVREGDSVSRSMREADILPPMLVAIVESGEASGKLGPALERAAGELDREVEAQMQVAVSLVEPMVLLAMGGLVLLMVMAILMPIIGLNDLAIV